MDEEWDFLPTVTKVREQRHSLQTEIVVMVPLLTSSKYTFGQVIHPL